MPNDNLKKYYSYLKSNGADVAPTYEAFANALSDENNAKKYHSYLLKNKFDAPQSYDVFSQKLGIVKKKETTVSPSVQKEKPISSGTQPKANQKPLGTSVSQKESKPEILFPAQKGKRNDVFTTEDGKTYRLDMSTGRPVWKGYTSSVVKGQGGSKQDYEIYNTIISNPNTVNALNKTFRKQASTSDTDQIYTGLVGKEENQYRVYNDNWQRLTPNSNNWEEVNSEGAISYLNKNYGKNVKVKPTVKKEDKGYQFTDINSQLISKTEEKVVPYLQRQYGKLGFNFEESGLGTDYVKVTSKNGNTIEVSLDENNPEEALKLKSFLQGNKSEIQTDASKKVNDLIREVNRFDLGSDYKKQASKRLDDYRSSEEFVNDLKYMNFNEVESNINSIKNNFIRRNDKKGLEDFYNSSAYKLYKEKQKEDSSVKAEKIDSLYYELKQAKTPEEKKQAKIKIDTYLSDKVINKQSDNYNIQLGDVSESYKKLNAAISQFDKDKADLDQRVNAGNISQEEYESLAESINKRAEYLDSRRQEIKSEKDGLISDMNKLQSITGQYLIDKEKTGSFGGNMLNSLVTGVSKIFEPSMQVLTSVVSDRIMMKLDPDELKMLKAKGYNDEEIKNYTVNKETKKLKEEFRSGLVETFGTSGTTKEYAQSKDRGFFEKSLSGVAESLPGMLAPGGAIVKVGSLGAQAYSSIEDEMLADKDFETTSALDRSVVALPYAIGMGVLENIGVSTAMSKNPLAKSLLTKSLLSAVKKVGGDASKEVIENVINKEIKSNIAKYGIRIVGGALAEAETGALQSAVLDIGLKKLYNSWKDANDGKTAEKLTEGEYFSTPDTFMGGLSQVAEDAAAEAIGGWAMTTVGTSAQAIMNKGQISLYNDKDVEFLKGLSTDPEVKKMFIAKLKTNMLQGSMTKSEAQEQLNSLNELESTFSKIPDNITGENLKKSVGLISERNKLTQEIEGKDESLTAVQQARISEINNELKTISENAVKESNIEEVTAEGGGIQREGTQEGQPEVGQGEGAVGQAAQPETDLGNRPVEGGRTEEESVTRNVINRPATLSEFGGKTFDTPLQGDTYVDGQQVVFEDRATGRIYELGNIDEVMDSAIPGLQAQEETISITPEGKVSIEGNNWNIQSELPTQGIEYNPAGEVTRVSLKDDAGNTQMFEGQQAVDIAYQIELQKIQSIEQQQFINDLLEQDEEFQTATESIKPRQIEAVVQEETAPDIVPTEPTVAEEVVVEQPVAEEVERLGKLLEGTDQQIDEQIGTLNVSKKNNKVAQSIANAAKAIAKILPDVKFVVHDTDESYRKATGEQSRSQSSSGEYNNKTKTIHINASKANNRTAAHEVFHAILLNKIGSDIELQRLTKAMIDSVLKSLSKTKGSEEVVAYLEKFASQYDDKTIFNEEKLAELFGILADNYAKLPADTKNIIQRFIDRVRKILGLKPMTDREVIDFMNTISQKVAAGQEITQKDISKISTDNTISKVNKRFQADFSDSVSKLSFIYDKNGEQFKKLEKDGFITRDKSLSDFNGKYIFLHQPDAAFSGMIFKDGEVLVEGKGGVFYPIKFHEDGYFWASTDRTAKKMADDLNKVMEQNGGSIYMALTSAPSDKLMSSTTMANAILDFFSSKALDKNFKVTPTQLKSALRKAANDVKSVNNKKVGLDLKLPSNATIEEMQSAIRTALGSENSSFADRKNFAVELTKLMASEINKNDIAVNQFGKLFSEGIQNKYFKGITKTGKLKISAANMNQALSEMFTEPMLKEGIDREKGGQVYAILELNGPVKAEPSTKHESYPMAIESANKDNKVTLHLLNDRQNWFDTFEDFETGDIVSKERQLKVYPTSGVSVRGLKVNTANVTTQKQEESIDSAVRKQKADTISGIVFTARQNGFSDAAISQYLLGKGYTQEQIDGALSAKAGTKNIDDIFEASQQEIRDKVKRKSIREGLRSLTRTLLNRQSDIKRVLNILSSERSGWRKGWRVIEKNNAASRAYAKLITKAGATGLASIRFKIAAKDIYGKLKESEIKVLDKIIYARRIISINENRAMKGLEPYRGMDGYSEVNAQQNLNTIKSEIGEDKFNDLNERADKYFNVFKENLKKLKESGRITEDVYNDLNEIEYSPIATIKYIISDNMDVSDMDREAARLGMSKDDIKKLTDRNENGIITDSRYLLAMNISSVESRAFENAMLNEVVKALDEATPEQQTALSEYVVFDNPIIGSFNDGRPKRKYDDEAVPSGFKKVYYFENGIEKYIIVREDMARQLLDVKNAKMQAAIENTAKTVPVIGTALKAITLTPARLLRFFATGGNPLFILGNVAVDWVNAVFNTDVYSNFKTFGMAQAGFGFAKNFIKKAVTNDTFNKTYNEFAEHGGLMEFLSNESMRSLNELKPGHKILSKGHRALEIYGNIMSFLGETSEVAMRLAVYEKMKSNLVSEFKKENGVDPNAQQMDDIMWEAAREARELIDFNQGGSWAKEADVVMPYLNAALQGFRKPLDYAKKNPVGFASSYIQLAGMGASIAAMSLAAAMNAMPSDDDDEEKKKKIRKALDSISDHEKASYHIIFTGKVDKNGELEYIRIKKLPVASVATTWAEQMMYKYLVDYEFDDATFNQTIEKSLPLSISELESKNPVVSGYLTYKYNEDTFTGEKVFRGPKDKVILETAEGVNDPKIESFYKTVAPVFGLSPARSKAFVEKIITNQSTNPTINIFYAAANGIFGKDTQFGTEFSTAMEKMKETAGKKLIRYTNENVLKYKKEDELEKEKIYITTDKYLKDSKIKADIKDRYNNGKTMTIGELEKIVKENYDPIDQQKYLKKYYTYTQTMNADPILLDLLYEDDPNIQALIINDTYGPSLEKEELDELVDVMQKSRRKVSSKAWYIYQTKYKNRK